MSGSQDFVLALRGLGLTDSQIGRAIGRDSSLVFQIGAGRKPGRNLESALGGLHQAVTTTGELATVEPPRRLTRTGHQARVRRATTIRGRTWETASIKRQASRSGGRGLRAAFDDAVRRDDQLAVTISFDSGVTVTGTSGEGRRGGRGRRERDRTGRGGTVTFKLDAADLLSRADVMFGGNLSDAIAAEALDAGYIAGVADAEQAVEHVTSIEVRAWSQ